jgi:hypothetical protein
VAESVRTLSGGELNRALLARQMLLARARITLPVALERMGGLQAQYAPSMYIGLWSRVERFERHSLTRALERGAVVQGTLMRSTIHLVSRRDYWPFAVAVREARRSWWLRVNGERLTAPDMQRVAERLRRRLAEGPVRRVELDRLVGKGHAVPAGLWVDMVRVPPSGTWERRRADLFGAADVWVGPEDVAQDDALVHLVRRYLAGFGPASRKDVADFSGVPIRSLAPAFDRMTLRRFRDQAGGELLDLPRGPLPPAETVAPVRFLPTWDATLLVHARRTGILPERYRPVLFTSKNPQSMPAFLVDGAVAGTWRFQDGRVRTEPFEPLPRAVLREVQEEAERLTELYR